MCRCRLSVLDKCSDRVNMCQQKLKKINPEFELEAAYIETLDADNIKIPGRLSTFFIRLITINPTCALLKLTIFPSTLSRIRVNALAYLDDIDTVAEHVDVDSAPG